MFPGTTKAGGQCFAMPDVCKTPAPPAPPVPIPYPNIAQVPTAVKTSTKVYLAGMLALTVKSEIPMSSGDEAGVVGGVMSNMNMNKVTYMKGSAKVEIQGQPAVYLTATTAHNGQSANARTGAQIAPSQTIVIVSS